MTYLRTSTRFRLHPDQRRTIDDAAAALDPARRHSFLLRVARVLQGTANSAGFCSDALVERAIAVGLAEVAAMRLFAI
jgi:hypothetical protein